MFLAAADRLSFALPFIAIVTDHGYLFPGGTCALYVIGDAVCKRVRRDFPSGTKLGQDWGRATKGCAASINNK